MVATLIHMIVESNQTSCKLAKMQLNTIWRTICLVYIWIFLRKKSLTFSNKKNANLPRILKKNSRQWLFHCDILTNARDVPLLVNNAKRQAASCSIGFMFAAYYLLFKPKEISLKRINLDFPCRSGALWRKAIRATRT